MSQTRVYNFNAGPSALPLSVLQQAQNELLDYNGHGMSIMEMSHRSVPFLELLNDTKQKIKSLYTISDDYDILFLQGGARHQFAMVPMNLALDNHTVQLINSGHWTTKAIDELEVISSYNVIASSEENNFACLPDISNLTLPDNASYLYMASNNTIFGTQFRSFPESQIPLVCDMSSDIFSRPININSFGLIFAGAQKNAGIAGLTLVIIRKDLLDRASNTFPPIFLYRTHANADSTYNTIPTFAVRMTNLLINWIIENGGLSAIHEQNKLKANKIYSVIEDSDFYTTPVPVSDRSLMNIVFQIQHGNVDLERTFVSHAAEKGIIGIKGHRAVGGLRASCYNAQTMDAIDALVSFMKEFEEKNMSSSKKP